MNSTNKTSLILIMKGKPLNFIHITKCAGTTIENVGKEGGIKWGRFFEKWPKYHQPFSSKPTMLKKQYDWFIVVRNPYSRILSEFYCKFGGVGKRAHTFNKKTFNHKIQTLIKRPHRGFHYVPQHLYVDDSTVIHILHFENLKNDFEKLMQKYKLNLTLNRKDQQAPVTKHLTVRDFNKKTLSLIRSKYHKDFESFGYSRDDIPET